MYVKKFILDCIITPEYYLLKFHLAFFTLTDVQEWYREPGQTIESALMENSFCDFPLEYEPLGESLAIKSDSTGFYTTSDWQENAPIYSYHFKC